MNGDGCVYKYDKIQVCGHPRSGTHFAAALIDLNFFDGTGYLRHYKKPHAHLLGNEALPLITQKPNWLFIYVWRDLDAVLNSLFKARQRFGLRVNSADALRNSRYCDIWTKDREALGGEFKITINTKDRVRKKGSVFPYFRSIEHTAAGYWSMHIRSWEILTTSCSNVMLIHYGTLISNVSLELARIGEQLEAMPRSYKKLDERVGWFFPNDGGIG